MLKASGMLNWGCAYAATLYACDYWQAKPQVKLQATRHGVGGSYKCHTCNTWSLHVSLPGTLDQHLLHSLVHVTISLHLSHNCLCGNLLIFIVSLALGTQLRGSVGCTPEDLALVDTLVPRPLPSNPAAIISYINAWSQVSL